TTAGAWALLLVATTGCRREEGSSATPPATGPTTPAPTLAALYDGIPPQRWAADLTDPDPARRYAALVALGSLGSSSAEYVDGVSARLDDESPAVRWAAAEALGRLADLASPFAERLVGRFDDPSPGVRKAAARAAGRVP